MKWIKIKPGVRYRQHATRKHGIRPDRYYTIFYKVNGKTVTEAVGWASKGWTAPKASGLLSELAENRRRGEPPYTLREKRAIEETRRQEKAAVAEMKKVAGLTFGELFTGTYKTTVKGGKHPLTWKREEGLFEKWISPIIGNMALKDITAFNIEKLKMDLIKAGRARRTIEYALGIVKHVFNFAIKHSLFDGANPVNKVKKLPPSDNRRMRFLSRTEAETLLAELAKTSQDLYDQALLSLHTGMRAGEIFSLTWQDVDFDRNILTLRDTKNGKTRPAFLTAATKSMLLARVKGQLEGYVFPARGGEHRSGISKTFARTITSLKLNEGIEDRRYRVCFHTLRHTFASFHVEAGTDLYTLKELMGHADLKMTSRYAHLGESSLRAAVDRLEATLNPEPAKVISLTKKG